MAFVQEWTPSSIASATSKTVTGTATTAGNTLFADVWLRGSTLAPNTTITDNGGNTWELVGTYAVSASKVHMYVCRGAASVTSVTGTWLDGTGAALNVPSMLVVAEYDPVGALVNTSTYGVLGGGEPSPIAVTDGALVRALLGCHSGTLTDTYTVRATGVTPTERAGYAPGQGNSTFLRADAFATSTTSAAIGWDQSTTGTVVPVIFDAAFDPPSSGADPEGTAAGTWTITGSAVGSAAPTAPLLYRVDAADVTPLWLGVVTATGVDLG